MDDAQRPMLQLLADTAAETVIAKLDRFGAPLPKRWLRSDEASRWMSVSKITLCTWRKQGRGPKFYRLGNAILYQIADIVSWVESPQHVGHGTGRTGAA